MTESPKTLLPHSDDYVLMHKRALVINSAALSMMGEYIARTDKNADTNTTSQSVVGYFAKQLISQYNSTSDEQISEIVNELIANGSRIDRAAVIEVNVV